MKYMHFRASCSFTALAEIMESYGVDVEDYTIAMEMKLLEYSSFLSCVFLYSS